MSAQSFSFPLGLDASLSAAERAYIRLLGTPILGDGKYGGRAAFPEGFGPQLMLHAREIALPHPDDGTTLRVTAPLPLHMAFRGSQPPPTSCPISATCATTATGVTGASRR